MLSKLEGHLPAAESCAQALLTFGTQHLQRRKTFSRGIPTHFCLIIAGQYEI